MRTKLCPLVVLVLLLRLCEANDLIADTNRPETSFRSVVLVANRGVSPALTNDQRRDLSSALSRTRNPLDNAGQNTRIREKLNAVLNKSELKELNQSVFQHYLTTFTPQHGFDWLEIEITDAERKQLSSIDMPGLEARLRNSRLEYLQRRLTELDESRAIEEAVGEEFAFRTATMPLYFSWKTKPRYRQRFVWPDKSLFPDCEPVRVIASTFVADDLNLTLTQHKQAVDLLKGYNARGLMWSTPDFELELAEEEMEKIRKLAIFDAEKILTENQLPRFRQIVLQRYLNADDDIAVELATRYLGLKYEPDKIDDKLELDAIRRLTIVPIVAARVEEIVGRDISSIVGPPRLWRNTQFVAPTLENSIARRLMIQAKKSNPRRER